VRAAASNEEAVRSADIVILAVPATAAARIAAQLGDALDGRVVVDVANRPTPDPASEYATSIAEEIQAVVPGARVVKAFNTLFASRQAQPEIDGQQADAYVAGDDDRAKATVIRFAGSIGLRPLDVGGLAVARTLEGMAWLHIDLQMKNGWPWQSAWKIVGPTPAQAPAGQERKAA
jgi:predicted dinucleotide-binding enzyme